MTKRERWIELRATEIWGERILEQEDYSYLKALSAAWAEDYKKRKVKEGGRYSVRQFGWLDYT